MLRKEGLPCIFYADYYKKDEDGNEYKDDIISKLIFLRKKYAYGEQEDYFYDNDKIGFVRKGDLEHENSGLAVVMTDRLGGEITMCLGEKFANLEFYDYLENVNEIITTDESGTGNFKCNDGSVSIWVKKNI